MKKFYKLFFLVFITGSTSAQKQDHVLGAPYKDLYSQRSLPASIANGNGTITTSYTTTACGLNFTSASVRLHQRAYTGMTVQTGVLQPAPMVVSGIPSCFTILKAFLYVGGSGDGVGITATIVNPLAVSNSYSMTMIGQHADKCWGYVGTFNYRADVTSCITGNGTYNLSGIPCPGTTPNDMDGATLIIIYSDPSQTFTGHMVISDGCRTVLGGAFTNSITGFNVCGTTNSTQNFVIVSDLQAIAATPINLNSTTANYTYPAASNNVWDYIQQPGAPATSGQTTAVYGLSNASDCYNFVAAGMYYRTACNVCTTSSFSVSTAVSSSCTVGSATATPVGGIGPYTYTWSPTGGNSSVISGATLGTYTVTVKDASCAIGFATVTISASPTVAVSNQTLCTGNTVTLTASGATTYSWSTSATTSQIVVSPTINTTYTVTGYNGTCSDTKTVSVTVGTTPVISAMTSNSFICAGQTITLSATGAISYTYYPGSITGNPIALNPTTSTTYTVLGNAGGACTGSALITQSVSPCTGLDQLSMQNIQFGIYPNPNKGEFTLTLPNASENCSVEIYNAIGQLIKKQSVKDDKLKINISEQPNGVYFLRVMSEGHQIQKSKIVKE